MGGAQLGGPLDRLDELVTDAAHVCQRLFSVGSPDLGSGLLVAIGPAPVHEGVETSRAPVYRQVLGSSDSPGPIPFPVGEERPDRSEAGYIPGQIDWMDVPVERDEEPGSP